MLSSAVSNDSSVASRSFLTTESSSATPIPSRTEEGGSQLEPVELQKSPQSNPQLVQRSLRGANSDQTPCLSNEEAQRSLLNSYIQDGNEAQLKIYLDGLDDGEFRRLVDRNVFERFPIALFSDDDFRKRLQRLPEYLPWMTDKQRAIYDSPEKCKFMGKTSLSLGKPSENLLRFLQNMLPEAVLSSVGILPAYYLAKFLTTAQKSGLTPEMRAELERYTEECKPESIPSSAARIAA